MTSHLAGLFAIVAADLAQDNQPINCAMSDDTHR
jgi:hypothetical protein